MTTQDDLDAIERAARAGDPVACLTLAITAATTKDLAQAQAWAAIASASALLQPEPTVKIEVDDATGRLKAVEAILDKARRTGPRHPAIYEALDVIRTEAVETATLMGDDGPLAEVPVSTPVGGKDPKKAK